MWWVTFVVSWAAFMSLLVLTIIHEDRKDAILRAQINTTLTSTLSLYPDEPEQAPRQLDGCAQSCSPVGLYDSRDACSTTQSVSSSGTATWNGRAKVG